MKPPFNAERRKFSGIVVKALAGLPLLKLAAIPAARAQEELPRLAEDDPTALALKYVHEAAQAERPDKMGVAGGDQTCDNCFFIQGEAGQEWRPCQLFPGKSVKGAGWCISWIPKQP